MAEQAVTDTPETDAGDGVRRRDFINIAAVSAAGMGGLATLVPLISQMSPSADVLAASSTEIDISAIKPGQAIKAEFRKQPVFVRNLTPQEIAAAEKVPLGELRDPQSLAERTKEGKRNWLITMGVCTWAQAKVRARASSAAISAPATVRTTIPPRASARAPRP
jgi:ubiquinol-cytochrome c reductase iron-sulfur subunit